MKTTLVGISGSLRENSYNTALLRAASRLLPPDVQLNVETVHGIPLYDADLENREGLPERVTELKEMIAAADGVILATPEYNNSVPGVFKNAIDWLSRPPADIPRIFGNKPIAVIGASPGGFGTVLSQSAWLPILRALKAEQWHGGRLLVPHAGNVFNADGELTDAGVENQLGTFVKDFTSFIRNQGRGAR